MVRPSRSNPLLAPASNLAATSLKYLCASRAGRTKERCPISRPILAFILVQLFVLSYSSALSSTLRPLKDNLSRICCQLVTFHHFAFSSSRPIFSIFSLPTFASLLRSYQLEADYDRSRKINSGAVKFSSLFHRNSSFCVQISSSRCLNSPTSTSPDERSIWTLFRDWQPDAPLVSSQTNIPLFSQNHPKPSFLLFSSYQHLGITLPTRLTFDVIQDP